MRPLREFPPVPERLEQEINTLYQTRRGSGPVAHTIYYASNAQQFGLLPEQASHLDFLVDWLHGTYEHLRATTLPFDYTPSRHLEFSIFQLAAYTRLYNVTLLVEGHIPEPPEEGDEGVIEFAEELQQAIPFFGTPQTPEQREGTHAALLRKLRFEAGIYEGMKRFYGVTLPPEIFGST